MAVYLTVNQRAFDKAFQLCIGDENGGYRIAGPKYDGNGKTILRRELTKRDADEIRSYLDQVK